LVIAPDQVAQDPHRLVGFLADHGITRIVLVPSLLKALLDDSFDLRKKLPKLRYWTSSGEELSAALANRFRKQNSRAVLLNLYGSSEVAADATYFECRGQTTAASVPIGRPIANTQVYLLDAHLQPVPIGVRGGLFVGGAGLARGYWRRPELTAAQFVANFFSGDLNSRLFQTGDLARYLPDGNLEYLGRADQQVKIRGQRVELSEVEAVLRQHHGVNDCAVVARFEEQTDGDHDSKFHIPDSKSEIPHSRSASSLVGYIVGNSSARPSPGELREFLKNKLPDYMVPSAFVTLESLPVLPSGKVDRRSLPPPVGDLAPSARTVVEPRTEAEAIVAGIWREVLRLERIGVDDDFFALGGHSLLGTQIVARLRTAFATELSLRDFFDAPTVAGIAAKIASAVHPESRLPAITPMSLAGKLPLSLAQEQFLVLDELVSGAEFLNLPYAYRLAGALNFAVLQRSLQTIVDRHAVLRTVFGYSDNKPVQRVRRNVCAKCPLVDLSSLTPTERDRQFANLSSEDANAPFDLEKGPLFRFKLVRFSQQEHVLLVTLHHIIADQWSLRLLRSELVKLYGAFIEGRASPLVDLPFQFADYVRWQKRLLDSGRLTGHIDYWQNTLAGRTPKLKFRHGSQRPKAVSHRTAREKFILDLALFARVRDLAQEQKITPFVVLLAGLDAWLYLCTGCKDLRIGTLVANRTTKETENLIGYFVNAVVLRARIAPRMTFLGLLRQTRDAALGAFAHQELPIEELARALSKGKRSARTPLYHVMLNYRRFTHQAETTGGLTFASLSDRERAADPEMAFTSADLNFDFREASTTLTVTVNFKVDLFDQPTIARMLKAFLDVLNRCLAQPEVRLSGLAAVNFR
jgi:hypothetical protein